METDRGTLQGGILSPLLANIYFHYALDLWLKKENKKGLKGFVLFVRYADDFIVCFQYGSEARAFGKALRERLAEFRLAISEERSRITALGRYQYHGMSGNTRGIKSYYYHAVRVAFKWINRRSQKKSYNWSQFNRYLVFNPLPKPKIYHLAYILYKHRGCVPEEPAEGKLQVRFCEGAHSSPGANTLSVGGL